MKHDGVTEFILIFDGVCNSCNAIVNFLRKYDHSQRLRFVPQQSLAGQKLIAQFNLAALVDRTMILIAEKRVFTFSAAVFEVLAVLGWPWKMFAVFSFLPRSVTDAAYRLYATHRYRWFGKSPTCRIPTATDEERFLP